MKRKIVYTLLGLGLFGCNREISTTSTDLVLSTESGVISISEDDAQLLSGSNALAKSNASYIKDNLAQEAIAKYFAKSVALALRDKGLAKILKNEIGKKFDGDFNVIWKHINNQKLGLKNLNQLTSEKVVFPNGGATKFSDVMATFPRIQVACPVHFEDWDANANIIVAYQPFTKDDLKTDTIIGFDQDLKEIKLDGKIPPNFPVLVITKNERTNNDGDLVPDLFVETTGRISSGIHSLERLGPAKDSTNPLKKQSGSINVAALTPVVPITWKTIRLGSNYDGWFDGSNEVALYPVTDFAKGGSLVKNSVYKQNTYSVGSYMFNYNEDMARYIGVKILERDDNDADLTLVVKLAQTIANIYLKEKIEIPYQVDRDDDAVGENNSIELIPQNVTTSFGAGDAQFTFSWDPNIVEYNITSMPFSAASSTLGKVNNWDVDGGDGEDVTYRLTPIGTSTKRYRISTCDPLTNFDTMVQVFDARNSTPYFIDDDLTCTPNFRASTVVADLAPGQNYYVVVDGYNGSVGNFKLNVTELPYP